MTKRVCFEIDADLYQRFKLFCFSRGENIKDTISFLISYYLEYYVDTGDILHVKDNDKN